jgi:hypothetical protein
MTPNGVELTNPFSAFINAVSGLDFVFSDELRWILTEQ